MLTFIFSLISAQLHLLCFYAAYTLSCHYSTYFGRLVLLALHSNLPHSRFCFRECSQSGNGARMLAIQGFDQPGCLRERIELCSHAGRVTDCALQVYRLILFFF